MQNDLSNYLNRELKDCLSSLTVVQGQARDTGNLYFAIELRFINGYSKRLFLRSDEQFAWINAFDQLDTETTINKEF